MIFTEAPVASCAGAVLAHTHVLGPGVAFRKGRRLSPEDVDALARAGIAHLHVARLEPGDLDEDQAAAALAAAVSGANVTVDRATTGRANLFSAVHGVLVVEPARVDAVNLVDERLTLATRMPDAVVAAGEMVATVKVIPFAVPGAVVTAAMRAAGHAMLAVAPLTAHRAGLIITRIGQQREPAEASAEASQRQRLARLGSELAEVLHVPHRIPEVAAAIEGQVARGLDPVLVLGASAVVDRDDVVPAAIRAVGGVVEHLGMPVDPGNLMLLGRAGAAAVLGVPGCARSLKRSGFDRVLERCLAGVPVTRQEVMRMGAGGLLAEVEARGAPRQPVSPPRSMPRVAAVVLAAGLGRRMGGPNKLLEPVGGSPMVRRVVEAVLGSRAGPVLVVVGHQASEVRAALAGLPVSFVDNPDYQEGLGASLRAGVAALDREHPPVDAALVVLSDMPLLTARHVDRIVEAFDPRGPASIVVPVHQRRRGHPVLWSSRHFAELMRAEGDQGGRALLERHADAVLAVQVDDPAIHVDVDTVDMLASARDALGDRESSPGPGTAD